jgi:Subtilase family
VVRADGTGLPQARARAILHRSNHAEGGMTEPDNWKDHVEPKIADETEFIIRAFCDPDPKFKGKGEPPCRGPVIKVATTADGGIDYMYAEGEILVRDEYLERVLEILEHRPLRELELDEPSPVPHVIAGVTRLTTLGDRYPTVVQALEVIEARLGVGIATPNHVLTVCPGTSHCPATEPETAYADIEPYPSVCRDNDGGGVQVYMADTGILDHVVTDHPWLTGVTGEPDPNQPYDVNGTLTIPPYSGHGTFAAGVARCTAPAAEITVGNVAIVAGSVLESDLIPPLNEALGRGVDIFHVCLACTSRHDFPLIAFRAWLERLRQYGGAVCLAAAGNSGMRRLTWPAAFSDVVAVGALGGDWRGRATFSNFGPWVDLYAPGRDLINAFPIGEYTCHAFPYKDQVRNFYGMAKWSGTSFSTPIVTGLIASRMSRTGENARQATAALLAEARAQAIPGVGPILLPCCRRADPRPCCKDAGPRPCCRGGDPRPCCG